MVKKIGFLILVISLVLALAACGCEHVWREADCLTAATCTQCGAVQGEPAGHVWQEATCDAPKTCTVCGAAEGAAADHQWQEATCQAPRTCGLCGLTEGEIVDHSWDTICKAACTMCGMENPDSPGHRWFIITDVTRRCTQCGEKQIDEHTCNWLEATCSFPKYCTVCLEEEGSQLGHTLTGDEVITRCETCQKDVEVFRDAKGKIRCYTEYETAADGSYTNPITLCGNQATQWYRDGEQTGLILQGAFCVDGKMYYRGSLLYEVSANTREDLMTVAQQHVRFQYAKYYEEKDQDKLLLASNKMLSDDLGQVYAVVDAYGARYILIHRGMPGLYPEDTIVVEYDWRS